MKFFEGTRLSASFPLLFPSPCEQRGEGQGEGPHCMKLVVLLLALLASFAHASSCRPPDAFILPRTSVEEGGLLYAFLPTSNGEDPDKTFITAWQQRALGELWVETTNGKALPFELKLVSRGDVFDVFSLKVNAKVGTEFIVKPVQQHFAITVVKRSKPAPLKLEITRGKDDNVSDSVSSQRIRRLMPSLDAPAFRVN